MTSVEHTAQQTGPIILHIDTRTADVQVVADERVTGTRIQLSTPDESGASVTAIKEASFRERDGEVYLSVKEPDTVTIIRNGNVQINANGGMVAGVVYGGMHTTFSNGGMQSTVGSDAHVTGGITVRAITEPGSTVDVKTMSGDVIAKNVRVVRADTQSGDVTTDGVGAVTANTMSGDITADGVTAQASLKSMSGDIHVSGSPGATARASTMSGNVTGSGVALTGSSMSGRVRQRRATAADEW